MKIILLALTALFLQPCSAQAEESVFDRSGEFLIARAAKLRGGKPLKNFQNLDVTGKSGISTDMYCAKDYYIKNGECTACPSNATCNGVEFRCNSGYATKYNGTGYDSAKTDTCTKCNSNANHPYVCDTYKSPRCKGSVTYTNNGTEIDSANRKWVKAGGDFQSGQRSPFYAYSSGNTCVQCPSNATCDGGPKIHCEPGYYKTSEDALVCYQVCQSVSCAAGFTALKVNNSTCYCTVAYP